MMAIHLLWVENKPAENIHKGVGSAFGEAFRELKKREVLSMGIIESIFPGRRFYKIQLILLISMSGLFSLVVYLL
jgi:hypothetical protein